MFLKLAVAAIGFALLVGCGPDKQPVPPRQVVQQEVNPAVRRALENPNPSHPQMIVDGAAVAKVPVAANSVQPELKLPDVRPILVGSSGVILGEFTLMACGEPTRNLFQDVVITKSGGEPWTIAKVRDDLGNPRLRTSTGDQIAEISDPIVEGTGSGQCTIEADRIICHFGTLEQPNAYVFPVNTTLRVLVVLDIKRTCRFKTISATMAAMKGNWEMQKSRQLQSVGAVEGPVRAVVQQ